ncbi:hypothetical protein Z951_42085 [Streptomyces sp. PRh5]|nr:hypothetical protein Z951_42085 [Streptomyces sp. PRh5]
MSWSELMIHPLCSWRACRLSDADPPTSHYPRARYRAGLDVVPAVDFEIFQDELWPGVSL